jgi:hypothetical protein
MYYAVYILLVGVLIGAWLLILSLFDNSLVISVATVVIMGALIALLIYYNSIGTDTDG